MNCKNKKVSYKRDDISSIYKVNVCQLRCVLGSNQFYEGVRTHASRPPHVHIVVRLTHANRPPHAHVVVQPAWLDKTWVKLCIII